MVYLSPKRDGEARRRVVKPVNCDHMGNNYLPAFALDSKLVRCVASGSNLALDVIKVPDKLMAVYFHDGCSDLDEVFSQLRVSINV